MYVSLVFVVSLVAAVSCHPLLFHLEKNGALSPDLICPDGASQCSDGSTCCKLKDIEGYGCCPEPQATCCEDGIHCCPHSYSCSNSNTCSKGDLTIPATKRLPATDKLRAKSPATLSARRQHRANITGMCPDDHSECPSTETCCLMGDDRYGCCPVPDAVCCVDEKHCCPYGYTCDLSTGTCESYSSSIPMLTKRPLTEYTTRTVNAPLAKKQHQEATNKPQNIMCDDKKTQCADGDTCCKLPHGKGSEYGCCPMSNAVCCSDGIHCCPSTYTCNVSGEICSKGTINVPLMKKVQGLRTGPQNAVCPDGKSECSEGDTCCQLASGDYGCCPEVNAVCCKDGKHCCPSSYTCNTGAGTCTKGSQVIAMLRTGSQNAVCPDGKSECSEGDTCCRLASGDYGCCPEVNAVCCKDGKHCCPSGYTCNTGAGTCTKGSQVIAMFKKQPAIRKAKQSVTSLKAPQNVECPDKTQCASNNTCCLLKSGVYACCPLPFAVCCKDGLHCCPNDYACQEGTGKCTDRDSTVAVFKKQLSLQKRNTLALIALEKNRDVPDSSRISTIGKSQEMCPDRESYCPDTYTCCQNTSGGYGCCPHGYTCDTNSSTCVKNVLCPDGKSECPYRNTCCRDASGGPGCCPMVNATCCSDGIHCCPSGYTCGINICLKGKDTMKQSTIEISSNKLASIKKQPSIIELKVPQNIVCPDQRSECGSNSTCCLLASGDYGCCPVPKAMCCSDKVHCCPEGYSCKTGTGTCVKGDQVIAMVEKQPAVMKNMAPRTGFVKRNTRALIALEKDQDVPDSSRISTIGESQVVTCPDGDSICPDKYTCCRNASGGYGCCPHVKAVCCDDSKHCCPEDYTCDPKSGSCVNGDSILLLSKKISATSRAPQNIMCPDEKTQCFNNNTCCQLESGSYSCCPAVNAVCCADRVHCCPSGTTCDLIGRKCRETEPFRKLSATNETPQNIICPDEQSECSNNETCCLLKTGEYGCCPTPNGVCCRGGVYCCPMGTTCDVPDQKCIASDSSVPLLKLFEKSSAAAAIHRVQQPLQYVYCPDGSYCLSSETCCEMSWGDYGCCPHPYAVCCSDDKHCCPAGTYCDPYSNKCPYYSESSIPPPKKQLLRTSTRADTLRSSTHVCPNGKDECSDNSTCCPLSSGQYGCCPVQKAICCPDNVHCCPQGYTCDTDAGTCSYKSSIIPILKRTDHDVQQITVKKLKSVICPDQKSECPSGSTCCKRPTGGFGCCPLLNADCCTDGEHCCPNEYKCDVSAGKCKKGDRVIAIFKKQPAIKSNQISVKKLKNVVCPDGKNECPDQNTCCTLASGDVACCPLANAVCCSDDKHCCPSGYTCGINVCIKGKDTVIRALLAKLPPQPPSSPSGISEPQKLVPCLNPQYYCELGHTCCPITTTPPVVYECCPIVSGVCCVGQKACCPPGYTCNKDSKNCTPRIEVASRYPFLKPKLSAFTVTKQHSVMKSALIPPTVKQSTIEISSEKLASLKKPPSIIELKVPQNIVCPDQRSECGSNSTCCLLASGDYGCCPVPKAICCSDKVHCCPEGYSCKTGAGTCVKGDQVIAMVEKQLAINVPQNVICPDQKSECSSNSTCCLLESGSYGCCPLPYAICCKDGKHCCPGGFTCKTDTETCVKGDRVIAMVEKQPAVVKNMAPRTGFVTCPDNESTCPDKTTCCKLKSGKFGCCPQVNGVCCSDEVHCCPTGFTCNIQRGICTKGGTIVVPFLAKLAVATVERPEGVIKCPDNSYCPDSNTCCQLESGNYGCCPKVHATCCSDKEHCCPQNYTCQLTSKHCTKGNSVIPMLKKIPSFSSARDAIVQKKEPLVYEPQNVICPDQRSQCPTDNTCCLVAGAYRCCPGRNAVCCGDKIHCCPEGYTCHVSTKMCTKGDTVVPMLKKSPTIRSSPKKVEKVTEPKKEELSRILAPLNVICPGQKLQCPDDYTCCAAAPSGYNCCPTPDAVCCKGSNHCCPKGYTCNATTKTCSNVEMGVVIPFMEAAASTATKDDVIEMTRDVL